MNSITYENNSGSIRLKTFYFENGVFVGYYIQDKKGVNWPVERTALKAYQYFKKMTAWAY